MAIANGTCVSFCTFGLPGYAPGTIAVNVAWMERGLNACQTRCCMYPSMFTRLRAIARNRYWSQIANFSYHLAFIAPVGMFPLEFREKFGTQKTRIIGLPGSEDSLTIGWAVSTQYQRVTDRRTDGRTDRKPIAITCTIWLTHVKNQHFYLSTVARSVHI